MESDLEVPECVVIRVGSHYQEYWAPSENANNDREGTTRMLEYINLLNAIGINKSITGKK